MNVKLHVLFLTLALLSAQHVFAADLSPCLARAESKGHRLDREDAVKACFEKNKSLIKHEDCFKQARANRSAQSSESLKEDLKAICFYETSGYDGINDCLLQSRRFRSSNERDEAVFYCYQIFQDKLNSKKCLRVAENLIFAAKREHLTQHCIEAGD